MIPKKTVVILSISSDIGFYLGRRYLEDGYTVVGSYRNFGNLEKLKSYPLCHLLKCNLESKKSIENFIEHFRKLNLKWDIFISCVGDLRPLTPFFASNFDSWVSSVHTNSLEQLRVLHGLNPWRNKKMCQVVFFAGGGVNKAVVDMSAYTISKIILIKMCEFLDAEEGNLNIFIIGPGWIRTKIHNAVLKDSNASRIKYNETKEFFRYGGQGIKMEDIYENIRFFGQAGKNVAGGRNFSLVYDPLGKGKREVLVKELKKDKNMYKLRRYRNDFKI